MLIKRNRDGSYLATGTCCGVPYAAEGLSLSDAIGASLLLVQRRHLATTLEALRARDGDPRPVTLASIVVPEARS